MTKAGFVQGPDGLAHVPDITVYEDRPMNPIGFLWHLYQPKPDTKTGSGKKLGSRKK